MKAQVSSLTLLMLFIAKHLQEYQKSFKKLLIIVDQS